MQSNNDIKLNSLAMQRPDLLTEWDYDKNTEYDPAKISCASSQSVWWKCPKDGCSWHTQIRYRTRPNGSICPACRAAQGRLKIGINDLASQNPEVLKEWHPTLNGDLTPEEITVGSIRKVWWLCPNGHSWKGTPLSRKYKHGCPYCSGFKVIPGQTDIATKHPELVKEWHPTKNGDLDPHNASAGSAKPVWWKCDKGHEWQAAIKTRAHGHGCPYCKGLKPIIGKNDLATKEPELAKEWHPTKNGDLKPTDITYRSSKQIWWQCKNGHEWQASASSRKNGGCPYCSGRRPVTGVNDFATLHPDLTKEWDHEQNDFEPSQTAEKSSKMVWWKCSSGHSWKATPYYRVKGYGCPICRKEREKANEK